MQTKKNKQSSNVFLYIVILIFIHLMNIGKICMPYFVPDEVGYWSCAAWINKMNWSSVVSQGGYYGWGYGIFLTPLLKCFDGRGIYYSAICLNIFLDIMIFFLLISIFRRLKEEATFREILMCSLCVACYTYIVVYTQLTMAEILLSVFYLLSVRLLYWHLEKPSILSILSMTVCLCFMFFIHMRMLIIIAAFISAIYLMKKYNMRLNIGHFWIMIGTFIFVLIAGIAIKNALVGNQYISDGTFYNMHNDSIIERASGLLHIFSIKFWQDFIISVIAKWFYLCMASFFTVIWGIISLFRIIFDSQKDANETKANKVVSVYIILSFVLGFLLNAYTMSKPERIDQLYYGRYVENLLLPVVGIGTLYIRELFDIKKLLISSIVAQISALLLYSFSNTHTSILSRALPLQCAGISGIPLKESNYGVMYSLVTIMVVLLVVCILYVLLIKINKSCFLWGIIIVWVATANIALNRVVYEENMLKRYSEIYDAYLEILDLRSENKDIYYIVTAKEGEAYYDSFFLQFCLKEITLHIDDSYYDIRKNDGKIWIINKNTFVELPDDIEAETIIWENERFFIME